MSRLLPVVPSNTDRGCISTALTSLPSDRVMAAAGFEPTEVTPITPGRRVATLVLVCFLNRR